MKTKQKTFDEFIEDIRTFLDSLATYEAAKPDAESTVTMVYAFGVLLLAAALVDWTDKRLRKILIALREAVKQLHASQKAIALADSVLFIPLSQNFFERINEMEVAADRALDGTEPDDPEMESISLLIAQGLTDRQIASLYGAEEHLVRQERATPNSTPLSQPGFVTPMHRDREAAWQRDLLSFKLFGVEASRLAAEKEYLAVSQEISQA